MGVKFFGQYLIEQGEIDAAQLREALDLMDGQNRQLGEIAVQKGYLRQADADRINLQQRSTDRQFGELAVETELLTAAQMDEIVALQQETRLFIGEALVQLESVSADCLPTLLDQFKVDQEPYESEGRTLVPQFDGNPVARLVLDLLPKFCMRIAKVHVKTGQGQPLSETASYHFNVGLTMHGPPSLVVILVADETFARQLASSASGIDVSRLTSEFIYDGLGEFLNVLCGNVVAILERDGLQVRLDPPTHDCNLSGGIAFELAVGEGCASLVLASP